MAEEIVEEVAKAEAPLDNIVVETAEDDARRASLTPEELLKEQESKPTDSAIPEVKEEVSEVVTEDDKPTKPSRSQRRIERQANENKQLKAEIEELKAKKEETPTKAIEPDMDDFENYEEYSKALEFYEKKSNSPGVKETPPVEKKESKEDSRVAEAFEDGTEDHEDFEELVSAPDLQLSKELLDEALESNNPSEVLYYLANNKELTAKIAKLNERGIQKEILKVELALENKTPVSKKVSKAPEPINPLNGGSEAVRTVTDAKSYGEYETLRRTTKKTGW